MKNNKKILTVIIMLIFTLVLTACSTGSANLAPEKTPQQIVQESFDKWYGLNSYEMDITMNMKIPAEDEVLDMSMTGKGTIFQKPIKMKMVMDTFVPGIDQKMTLEQYAVQDEQRLAIYQNIENYWQKIIIDDPAMMEMASMDPKDNLKLFMDNLVSAEMLGEEKVGEKDALKIRLVASGDIINQLLEDTAGGSLGVDNEAINAEIISQIGDIVYIIWIDKTTIDTLKCYMDLSENMRNLGKALAENPNMTTEILEGFANIEMSVEYTILNHNNAEDFNIPEDGLNAPEMELPAA